MRAKRTDHNQAEIVRNLRKCGLSVIDLSAIGNGVPDLLISDSSQMWLCEVKSTLGKLNPMQRAYHLAWRGKPIIVAKTFDEVYETIRKAL